MNLFEKIFNYQIISRLDESGTFTMTSHERSWLKTMLNHPAATEAFAPHTLDKLQQLLQSEFSIDMKAGFAEKASSVERQVYHPLLRKLRRIILNHEGILITYRNKYGTIKHDKSGLAHKLEYSMVKREWYLLWYNIRHHTFMSTKLKNIDSVEPETLSVAEVDRINGRISTFIESQKSTAVLEVVKTYNRELSRILYAFSCFDKKVTYTDDTDTYHIRVTFIGGESEYVLSKIRFLGKRIRIVESLPLQQRMQESATKALARYGVIENEQA